MTDPITLQTLTGIGLIIAGLLNIIALFLVIRAHRLTRKLDGILYMTRRLHRHLVEQNRTLNQGRKPRNNRPSKSGAADSPTTPMKNPVQPFANNRKRGK